MKSTKECGRYGADTWSGPEVFYFKYGLDL